MNFIRQHLINSIDTLSQDISGGKTIAFDDSIYNGRHKLYGLLYFVDRSSLPMIKDFKTGIFVGVDWDIINSSILVEIYNVLKEKQYFLI